MWRCIGKDTHLWGRDEQISNKPRQRTNDNQSHNSTQEQVGEIMGLYGLFIETWVTPKYLYHQNFLP